MTKKTNSLILRYGVQTLWKNTIFLFKISISTSFFFNFLQFELWQRKFELLYIDQKKFNIIYAFVFCFFWEGNTTTLPTTPTLLVFKVIKFYRYWFLLKFLYFYFSLLVIKRVKLLMVYLFTLFPKIAYFTKSARFCNYTLDHLHLTGLFFKVEQIRLESILSFFFKRHLFIKLQNVFNLPLYFNFIDVSRKTKLSAQELTTLEFMFYISCKLRMVSIFTRYLAKTLSFEKRHKKLFWQVVNTVTKLNAYLSLFKGFRMYVTGKLDGKMRRKKYSFKFGQLAVQQIKTNLDYSTSVSFTKYGAISIKIWLFF